MKHLLFSVLITLVLTISVNAQSVDQKTATAVGTNFMIEKLFLSDKSIDLSKQEIQNVNCQGQTAYYIINYEDGAFVLVAASKNANPVLGYSFEGNFDLNNISPSQEAWMEAFSEEIVTNKTTENINAQESWEYYISEDFIATKDKEKGVSPLNSIRWNQGYPYNNLCPEHPSGPGGRCVTGCVATAMGMVMKHWDYPTTGSGQKTYFWGSYYTIHFDSTTYEWQNMTNTISYSNPTPTARLLFHCGVSCNMGYGPSASGTQTTYAADALKQYFDYIPTLDFYESRDYTYYDWVYMLKEELDYGRPIVYSGYDDNYAGHAFVCDGYQDNMSFHFNWGWGGSGNGYYYLYSGSPNTLTYYLGQDAILGIMPPTAEFCSSMEYTQDYWTFNDGSSYSWYQNDMSCEWLINPTNGGPIRLSFSDFKTESLKDILYVYDGSDANAPLIGSYSGTQIPSTIVSSGDELFLRFDTDNATQKEGWVATYTNQPVAIETYENIDVSIFPQPAENIINIKFESSIPDNTQLSVFDIAGKLVYSNKYEIIPGSNDIQINVSGWVSGIYILKLQGENLHSTSKISVL
jgi:Peptidase C10 family/CUB domain/Spi protease inhibitor/Secretion system C-terminal sorting domain